MIEDVKTLAKAAGEAILEVYRRDAFDVSLKDDKSPVTEADKRADQVIVDGLKQVDPSIPFLTEESSQTSYDERSKWERFWLVDPLDGTKEFLKKTGQFTVNIALIEQGKPVLGVVWAPVIEWLYWGTREGGAFKRAEGKETAIRTREPNLASMALVASKDHAGPQVQALKEKYPGCELKSMGSSLKLCLVAEGEADLYLRDGPTMEWDTGAADAIVRAAGGVVERWDGSRGSGLLEYNKQELLNPKFLVKGDPKLEVVLS